MSALTDPISDFLTRFKNAARAGRTSFSAPHSKIKEAIAKILEAEGYAWKYEVQEVDGKKTIQVTVKYRDRKPVLRDLKRVSRPGVRSYVKSAEIPRVLGGLGISIVSTSKGLLTGAQAKRAGLGGELIAFVW